MVVQSIILLVTHLVLPFVFIIWLWKGTYPSKVDWMVRLLLTGAFIAYISSGAPETRRHR